MLTNLRYFIQGLLVLLAVFLNTVFSTLLIFLLAVVKLITPGGAARNTMTHWLSSVGEYWISVNQWLSGLFHDVEWDLQIPHELDHDGCYLVFSNHQSWVDILVLQHCLNRRVPFMRFLLKQELIWVPFLGFCWWALDMVFLRRYSKSQLLKNPKLRGKDLENAAHACEKLKHIPVSMMAFPEGTRCTAEKQKQQNSPFNHLLKPRYGGIGQVLYSLGDVLDYLIDVTIVYPDGPPNVWKFVSGQVKRISVNVRVVSVTDELRGKNYKQDNSAKNALKAWLNGLWIEKDRDIAMKMNRTGSLSS